MTTFKVGDKVRRKAEERRGSWEWGDRVYKVSEVLGGEIRLEGITQTWLTSNFELAACPITLTPEAIRAAAATSPEAAAALRVLAPGAFVPERLSTKGMDCWAFSKTLSGTPFRSHLAPRVAGNLSDQGFWLDKDLGTWAIETDNEGAQILTCTPTQK